MRSSAPLLSTFVAVPKPSRLTITVTEQIKADRGEVGASEENIKKMQEETSAAFEAERKEGGS